MTGLGVEGEGICDFADRGVAAARFFVSEIVRIVRGVVAVQLGIFVRIFGLRGRLERGGVGGLGLAELGFHDSPAVSGVVALDCRRWAGGDGLMMG